MTATRPINIAHKPWLLRFVGERLDAKTVVRCSGCKTEYTLAARPAQVLRWLQGELIQKTFPEMTNAERELLISGTCDDCWKKLWAEEE